MKKLLITTLLLLTYSLQTQAQEYWQNTSAGGTDFVFFQDDIWVAGDQSLYVVNESGEILNEIKSELGLAWSSVNDLTATDSEVWLATDVGVYRFDSPTSFIYYSINSEEVFGLDVNSSGVVYAGNANGLYEFQANSFTLLNSEKPVYDLETLGEEIFVKTRPVGRILGDGDVSIFSNGNWSSVTLAELSGGERMIREPHMFRISESELMLTSSVGYAIYGNGQFTYQDIQNVTGNELQYSWLGTNQVWHADNISASSAELIKVTETDTLSFKTADGLPKSTNDLFMMIKAKSDKIYVLGSDYLYWADTEILPFHNDSEVLLDANRIKARVNSFGPLFHNSNGSVSAFELNDLDAHGIFAANLWLTAEKDGIIYSSTPTYFAQGRELSPGTYNDDFVINKANLVKITREEVDYHRNNYTQSNYEMPWSVKNWPGSGDESIGELKNIAPFFDVDGNGVYTPGGGDYPSIMGDQMIFLIMNDVNGTEEVGNTPLGVELHISLFSYDDASQGMDQTIFMNYNIVNRSGVDYSEVRSGMWVDFDLGNAADDFIGSDSVSNIIYVYNGDANDDEEGGPSRGFGENPPALGIKLLCDNLYGAIYYNLGGGITGDPNTASDHHNYLNLRDKAGNPFMEDGKPVKFTLSGDPVANEGPTQASLGGQPGDMRMTGVMHPKSLMAGESLSYTFAIGYARENTGNYLNNINLMKTQLNAAQDYLLNKSEGFPAEWAHAFGCSLVGIDEESSIQQMEVYPNPTSGLVYVESKELLSEVQVVDITGKVVHSENVKRSTTIQLNLQDLIPGVYLLKALTSDGESQIQKLTIE